MQLVMAAIERRRLQREATDGDGPEQQGDDHDGGEDGGPARVAEGGRGGIGARRPTRPGDRDLAWLTDGARSGASLGGGRAPGRPGARG